MWDGPGPRQGPRGGPPFRGDHRGEMFYGRDHPMQDYRGRDGMNMGPMGNMGPRHLDLPPMDMRRMDGPPVRGHDMDPRDMDPRDMDPRDMRGREPNRDFFRPGEDPEFSHRRHHDFPIRDRGFPGPGRTLADMGGRGMPPRDLNDRYMDMRERDRDSFHYDMPHYSDANMDGRRMFPPDRMERDGGFRDMRDGPAMDMRDRPPMDITDSDRFDMDVPPRERRLLETERRGGPPRNPRGGFDSDMDFRNRHGPSPEFRGRDRSPLRYGSDDAPPGDRGRSDMPPDVAGPQRSEFMGSDSKLEESEYPDQRDSPLMDYRCGEEMTLAEEWKNRKKDKNPFLTMGKGLGGLPEPSFPVGFGRDLTVRDQLPYQERERPPVDFQGKDAGFPHGGRFPPVDLPPIGGRPPHNRPLLESSPFPGRENHNKQWLGEGDQKHSQSQSIYDERSPYHKEKNTPLHDIQVPSDGFKGLKDNPLGQDTARQKVRPECDIQSSTCQPRDQDYRDIDYRTGSTRTFEYNHEELQATGKPPKESDQVTPSEVSESGSQDQDYRSASLEGKVSNTISVTGIPKTATMEQILGAFAGCDGVPMPGIKIKNVVPGYSYDTAYVEFLNLEDAVHFMESNKGSLKIGTRSSSMKFFHPDEHDRGVRESDHKVPQLQETSLPRQDEPLEEMKNIMNGSKPKGPMDPLSNSQWQRSSDLTPEAWQQQVDQQLQQQEAEQQAESWGNRNHPSNMSNKNKSVFKDSKTLIIKNVKPTTTVETILKALDPFAYLDERNVRLVKAKQPGARGFCFVDMDSHEQVTRLVDLLTKPKPLYIDGVRVYAEVARPLKNQSFKRDYDQPNSSILGYPPETSMVGQQQQQHQQFPQPPQYMMPPTGVPAGMQGDILTGGSTPDMASNPGVGQSLGYSETPAVDPSYQAAVPHIATEAAGVMVPVDGSQTYVYGSEIPDMSNYLYDSTSGFYYDPETTLYYDPGSRYFYNAQTQEYLYWDAMSKTYIPVPGNSAAAQPLIMTAEDQAILSNPAADAPLEMKKPTMPPPTTSVPVSAPAPAPEPVPVSVTAATTPAVPAQEPVQTFTAPQEKKEDEESKKDKDTKEDKPRSLAAVKIMKDMERWAKIQNRQKESVRAASPVLKGGMDDDRRQSKSADAGFAIFERKIAGGEDLFKKPLAPPKKDEKSKRPMGSLGMLASDYAAGSDEEVEEDKEEASKGSQGSQSEDKDSKLTDWKKMACLLCRRQFPNKDALIRHQQLSDLHKQNMEIHLKIKRSKKELEALENQEKELNATESAQSPEQKRKKHRHIHHHRSSNWAGSSKESKAGERPGLGAEPAPQRKKKEHVVWDHATYKQAVRKAMFARFKELE